jgi:short-subunit dehydrogenase involved in D-alanine esterification of teichoic acids
MGVRKPDICREIVEKSVERSLWKDKVFYEKCDIGDMNSTKEFAKKVQQKFSSINIIINNGKFNLEVLIDYKL